MDGLFGKSSEVGKRIKGIEKSMSAIDVEIRALSRELSREQKKDPDGKGGNSPDAGGGEFRHAVSVGQGEPRSTGRESFPKDRRQNTDAESNRGGNKKFRHQANRSENPAGDKRLITYLASKDFQPSRPLKHQRRIQRNRAIIMLLIVGALLVWIIGKAFLS